MPAIGILGGMGPQASNKLYELLVEGTKNYVPNPSNDDYPEIVLLSVPVPDFISNKEHKNIAKEMLIKRTKLLEQAGSIVNGIACNTAHLMLPDLQKSTFVPFISIPKLVAKKVKDIGVQRVGLLASPTTLGSKLYDDEFDETTVLVKPNKMLTNQIEKHIYKMLSGTSSGRDILQFRKIVHKFKQDNNLDVVILGCTELPLIFGHENEDKSVIDSLQVLADGLLAEYFNITLDLTILY